jgi:hypothetical protein
MLSYAYLALGVSVLWQGRLEDASSALEKAGGLLLVHTPHPAAALLLNFTLGLLGLAQGRS